MRAICVLMLVACSILSLAAGEAPRKFEPIGTLKLEDVFRNAKIYTTRMEQLEQEKADANNQIKQAQDSIKQMDTALEAMNPTNANYAKIQDDREVLKTRLKLFVDHRGHDLDGRAAGILKDTFTLIRGHLKEFAQERQIKLIELSQSGELNSPSMQDLRLELGLQSTLYSDPSLDITEPFLSYLNAHLDADQATLKSQQTLQPQNPQPTGATAPATGTAPTVAPANPAPTPAPAPAK